MVENCQTIGGTATEKAWRNAISGDRRFGTSAALELLVRHYTGGL